MEPPRNASRGLVTQSHMRSHEHKHPPDKCLWASIHLKQTEPRQMPPHLHLFRGSIALLLVMVVTLLPSGLGQTKAHAARVEFRWDYPASGAAGFVLYCG